MRDCKCGRSIPKEWTRCAECAKVAFDIGESRQEDEIALRHKLTLSIARMRGETPAKTVDKILAVKQANSQRALAQKYAHENLAPALKKWMESN